MGRCLACQTLIGRTSLADPHEHLQRAGMGVFGTPRHPVTRYVQYRCTSCGSWLHQNTWEGSPPGLWSASGSNVPSIPANEHDSRTDWRRAAVMEAVAMALGKPR